MLERKAPGCLGDRYTPVAAISYSHAMLSITFDIIVLEGECQFQVMSIRTRRQGEADVLESLCRIQPAGFLTIADILQRCRRPAK